MGIHCQNSQALAALLTDDIVIDHALGYAEGLEQISKLKIPFFGLRHQMTNQVVFINAEGDAALLSCLNAPQVVSETLNETPLPMIYANCIVVDAFRRGTDGLWRFSRRTFDQLKLNDVLGPQLEAIGQPAAVRGPQREKPPLEQDR